MYILGAHKGTFTRQEEDLKKINCSTHFIIRELSIIMDPQVLQKES
jgi:hypothetical protein